MKRFLYNDLDLVVAVAKPKKLIMFALGHSLPLLSAFSWCGNDV